MTSSLEGMLGVFDVTSTDPGEFTGTSDAGSRDVIDGSQLLAQAIVAAAKTFPAKSVRTAHATFCRPARANALIQFRVSPVHDGRTMTTAIVNCGQGERTCATVTVLLDTPTADVIRHPPTPPASTPETAVALSMPLVGREIRLVGVVDPDDPDEVGPPVLDAWLRYSKVPGRPDLRRALLAHFTGLLGISTTMRAHRGIGTRQSHLSVSTAPMAIGISFHDPVTWDGWILYHHESTSVGAGMSYVRGQIWDRAGSLLASFHQDAMIRAFDAADGSAAIVARARL
jgi:acyl-CoA thioesterase